MVNELALKELGKLQEKILQYLARSSESHNQKIQKGINHPLDQYGSIHNATKTLKQQGYIKSKKGLSQKKVEIDFYSLSEKGLIYTLLRHPNIVLELADVYLKEYPPIRYFQIQYKCLGHNLAMKVFKLLWQSEVLSGNLTKAGLNAFTVGLMNKDFSPKELERYQKCLLKGLPSQFRKILLDYKQRIDKINFKSF